jgi:hypothetical protein
MSEKKTTDEVLSEHAQRRRKLFKNAGKLAVTGAAVSLLLANGSKPASAEPYGPGGNPTVVID